MSDSVRPHRWQPTRQLSLGFSRQEHWSGLPFPSPMHESEKWKWSCSVVPDFSGPHGLQPTRLLRPWDFPGKSTGVGYQCLLHTLLLHYNCVFQFSSVAQLCPTLCDPMNGSTLAHPVLHQFLSLPKLMFTESVMLSNHLILCHPFVLLPSIFPSIRVFSDESALCVRWPKYYSFSFNISPSNEHPGLISFRMDWLDFLAVQGTLKSFLQHRSSKASILWCSVFFIVQLSHPYMTTGKTRALTRRTFVDKVMSLLCSMLSRLVITFLPRSKRLFISWLQSPSAVILEPQEIKSDTVSTVSPSICH